MIHIEKFFLVAFCNFSFTSVLHVNQSCVTLKQLQQKFTIVVRFRTFRINLLFTFSIAFFEKKMALIEGQLSFVWFQQAYFVFDLQLLSTRKARKLKEILLLSISAIK